MGKQALKNKALPKKAVRENEGADLVPDNQNPISSNSASAATIESFVLAPITNPAGVSNSATVEHSGSDSDDAEFLLPTDPEGIRLLAEQLIRNAAERQELKRRQSEPAADGTKPIKRRNVYTNEERLNVLKIYDSYEVKVQALDVITKVPGYEKISSKTIRDFRNSVDTERSTKPMGRPTNKEFEQEVLAECLAAAPNSSTVTADNETNCSYSYDLIRSSANKIYNKFYLNEETQTEVQKWHNHPLTANLKFSDKWIIALLKRNKIVRTGRAKRGSEQFAEGYTEDMLYYDSEGEGADEEKEEV